MLVGFYIKFIGFAAATCFDLQNMTREVRQSITILDPGRDAISGRQKLATRANFMLVGAKILSWRTRQLASLFCSLKC